MAIVEIMQENFEEKALAQGSLVILDFWAAWCAPCRMQLSILESFCSHHPEVLVGRIDVDSQPDLAQRFGIQSIPTLVALKNGRFQGSSVGIVSEENLAALLGL